MRVEFDLKCTECGDINYRTSKEKGNTSGRLEVKKFCPRCKKHTVHKEVK